MENRDIIIQMGDLNDKLGEGKFQDLIGDS